MLWTESDSHMVESYLAENFIIACSCKYGNIIIIIVVVTTTIYLFILEVQILSVLNLLVLTSKFYTGVMFVIVVSKISFRI
jgi:hypothetical protein